MTVDEAVLIDYALGTVSREQAREVESLLRADPESARRLRRMQDDLAALVLSLPPESVDERAEDDLVERLRGTSSPPIPHERLEVASARRSPRWVALGLAVALGVAAWLILGPWMRSDGVEQTVERYQAQPGALSSRLITDSGRDLGTLVRLPDGRLFVAFDERPASGVYQLWEVDGEEASGLAVVEGRAVMTEPAPGVDSVAVTVEPVGGSDELTSEPLVVAPLQ